MDKLKNKPILLNAFNKSSRGGALALADDRDTFYTLLDKSKDTTNTFMISYEAAAREIQALKDVKAVCDVRLKFFKGVYNGLRENLAHYMQDRDIDRLEGDRVKSITLQEQPKKTETKITKQIKNGNKYVDADSLSKEDLILMLEKKGIKTRVKTVDVVKDESLAICIRTH